MMTDYISYGNQYKKVQSNGGIKLTADKVLATGAAMLRLPNNCFIKAIHTVSTVQANAGANITILAGDHNNIAAATPIVVDAPVDSPTNIAVEHVATKLHTIAGTDIIIKSGCNPFTSGTVYVFIEIGEYTRRAGDLFSY